MPELCSEICGMENRTEPPSHKTVYLSRALTGQGTDGFSKNLCALTLNENLSNETTFSQILLAGQYL
jgi:hypothetical protein